MRHLYFRLFYSHSRPIFCEQAMYATQTFLGLKTQGARCYVYFLTETYLGRQKELYDYIRNNVSAFGLETGRDVAVMIPHEGAESTTLQEVRNNENLQEFYRANIEGGTPGLLLTFSPIETPGVQDRAIYFSLAGVRKPSRIAKSFIRSIGDSEPLRNAILKINSFVILKPEICGVGIDINALIERLARPGA